jgi:hypothetical protein
VESEVMILKAGKIKACSQDGLILIPGRCGRVVCLNSQLFHY